MFSNEIKETVYVAITSMVIALVLGVVAVFLNIRSDFAAVRNAELLSSKEMEAYRAFNKYSSNEDMYGEDIIEAIREYQGSAVEVYVDSTGAGILHVTAESVKLNPSSVSIERLQQIIPLHVKYSVSLAYNHEDVRNAHNNTGSKGSFTEVTGILFKRK